jgi:hypothetical protein
MVNGRWPKRTTQERFDAKWEADPATGCNVWTGCRNSDGYGQFRDGGGMRLAHRVAWELAHGQDPDVRLVMHLACDNPACVNVEHLGIGTHADNMRDMVAKGRQARGASLAAAVRSSPGYLANRPRGERHHMARLTAADVAAIRAEYARGGVRQVDLAGRYGVSQVAISAITRGKAWAL